MHGNAITTTTYPAYLSVAARELRKRIVLVDRVKNGIEYKNVFDGREAVVKRKETYTIIFIHLQRPKKE